MYLKIAVISPPIVEGMRPDGVCHEFHPDLLDHLAEAALARSAYLRRSADNLSVDSLADGWRHSAQELEYATLILKAASRALQGNGDILRAEVQS